MDFEIPCPTSDPHHAVFWRVILLFLAYPIGLPLFFMWTLWRHEVPRLAKVKKDNMLFIEVLKEFKTRAEQDHQSKELTVKIGDLLFEEHGHRSRLLITDNLVPSQLEAILQYE